MDTTRQKKVAKLIQREVVDHFQALGLSTINNTLVTITGVRMSPDLSIAKIYLSFLPSGEKDKILGFLDEKKGAIRGGVGNKLRSSLRKIPELMFYHDETAEYSQNINKILNSLDIPPDDENDKV